jgi:hypothetical protein
MQQLLLTVKWFLLVIPLSPAYALNYLSCLMIMRFSLVLGQQVFLALLEFRVRQVRLAIQVRLVTQDFVALQDFKVPLAPRERLALMVLLAL